MKPDDLTLHEAALLLALRDREGTIAAGTPYHYALGGALVAELLLRERVAVDTEGRRDYLRAVRTVRIGEPVLDDCLAMVSDAARRKTVQAWVVKFAGMPKLKHRVAEGLVRAGVLRADEDRVLGIFSRKIYPEADPEPERRLIARIRDAVLSDSAKLDPKLVVLVSLARHAGLLRAALTRKEMKERKARLAQIENGEVVAKAVKGAVEAMNAAIMTAAIIPAICASSS
jgi:golgi phosphoprotein 3